MSGGNDPPRKRYTPYLVGYSPETAGCAVTFAAFLQFPNMSAEQRGERGSEAISQQLVKVNLVLFRGRYRHSHDCG